MKVLRPKSLERAILISLFLKLYINGFNIGGTIEYMMVIAKSKYDGVSDGVLR